MSAPASAVRRSILIRRLIYLLVIVAVVTPYLVHLPPQKFEPSNAVRRLYDKVDGLPAGSRVLISLDFDPSAQPELDPMARAVLHHCFQKRLVPVVMTHRPTGVGVADQICADTVRDAAKELSRAFESGRDYVFLGYRPGGANLILNMGENFKGAFSKDYFGRPTESMPALEGIHSLRDISMIVDVASGNPGIEMWIAYGSDRFGVPLGAGSTAVFAPDLYPFLQSGQIVGLMGGLRGAADYEVLLRRPAEGERGMWAQSSVHVLLVVLIVGANIRLIAGRLRRRRKGTSS